MAHSSGGSIAEVVDDLGHTLTRSSIYMSAKSALEMSAVELSGGSMALASGITSMLTQGVMSAGAIAALGGVGIVSASLAVADSRREQEKVKAFYKEELAANQKSALGVPQQNRTVEEALAKTKKERNFGVALSVVASIAALTLVTLVFAGAPETIGLMVAKGLAGLMTYNMIKTPLKIFGGKALGFDQLTTHDHIVALEHQLEAGKHITREQVVAIFMEANPEISSLIANKFGKDTKKLTIAEQEEARDIVIKLVNDVQGINIDALTDDINHHKKNVGELAFAVDGQLSGVQHDVPVEKPKSLMVKAVEACVNLGKAVSGAGKKTQLELAPQPAIVPTVPPAPKKPVATEWAYHPAQDAIPGMNVKRLGRDLMEPQKPVTQLERLAARAEGQKQAGEQQLIRT